MRYALSVTVRCSESSAARWATASASDGSDFHVRLNANALPLLAVRSAPANALERAVRANWFNGGDRLAAVIECADAVVLDGHGLKTAMR